MPNLPPPAYCPGCSLPLAPGAPGAACPRCALPLTGPVPQRVREIDAELWRLEARRTELLATRQELLAGLRASGPGSGGRADAAPADPSAPAAPPAARNVLLALGGALLAVAVTAFTLVSWGRLGIGGRSAVLGALTLLALGVPVALLRRGLTATAEAVASLGLVLLLLDAYALHRVALPGAGGAGYAAVSAAVTAALWAGYGAALPRLRGPLPVALCLAQLPLPLWVLGADGGPYAFSWALLATASGDAAVALWCAGRCAGRGRRAVTVTALAAGCALGAWGLLTSAVLALTAARWAESAHAAALLAAAAAVLLYAARRLARTAARTDAAAPAAVVPVAVAPAAVAGLAVLVAGGSGLWRVGALPEPGWPVLGFLLCALALGAVPVGERSVAAGLRLASAAVCAGAALWALPAVARLALGPLGWVFRVWDGAPQGARAAVAPGLGWPYGMALPAVLGTLALAAAAVGRGPGAGAWVPREWRTWARGCVPAAAGAAAAALPVVLDLPYRVAVVLLVALVVLVVLLPAVPVGPVRPGTAGTAPVTALVAAVAVSGWSLAEPAMTVAVLGALAAAFAGAAVVARADAAVGPVAAVSAVLWSGAFAAALPLALGVPLHRTAFAVLGVAVATVPLAARLRAHPAGAAVEWAGYAVAAAAVALTVAEPVALSLALALCGVAAGGVALRAERRPVAAYAGGALLVLAWWVRLGSWEVASPEAYTLPVTVPALAIGHLHRIRPEVSSWAAYGPGLATTLVPSLAAVWMDAHWPRPLLLGTAALALTVLGARSRLKAPLLLGGGTAALVAVHELAPHVVQVAGLLPRWATPAAAGVLLLLVGATYERRLRDARRLRRAVGRMR
ncbi:SCO7613 C-terminal domain-containing membrane protein [Streptomyces sp. HK10]|uniref:SCO7613 C-terminal domain-containing membrane protein n=1 Tax=Streptomyces sp. HK10 TaxID=3373255 RepID=UPI0037496462